MVGRIIENAEDIDEGLEWLCAAEPRFSVARDLCGDIPLRRRGDGFSALLSAITSQQLSVASAASIWARIEGAGMAEPENLKQASDEELRTYGFSRPKITYARDLVNAELDYAAMRALPNDDVLAELTAIRGIGTWTAEIYLMFSLGRADVFAPGDLALQESARDLFGLDKRPDEKSLRVMATNWSPWRSVAARLLWAYYHVVKDREGIR